MLFILSCADPESFVKGGPQTFCFKVDQEREDQNITKSVPLSARQRCAINIECWLVFFVDPDQ